jgi:protein gp37
MGSETIIAWTEHSFNIAWGCVKVSPGCQHCYAEAGSTRYGHSVWGPKNPRRTFSEAHWKEPLKWNRQAEKEARRHRVFCSSMCDNFEDHPTIDAEREKLWPLIRATPWLQWQLLTKRIERVAARLPPDWGHGYHNVWMGASVENQKYADLRIPILLQIPAVVHFISYEPALGPVDLDAYLRTLEYDMQIFKGLDWVICGGESGAGYRPMDPQWARDVRDQCKAAGVSFFFKQSSAPRTEMGIELDGKIVREYPLVQISKEA